MAKLLGEVLGGHSVSWVEESGGDMVLLWGCDRDTTLSCEGSQGDMALPCGAGLRGQR